jgi:protein-disulfide isomerase
MITDNVKLIVGVVLASVSLVMLLIWGLSKMGGVSGGVRFPVERLVAGASMIKTNGEEKVTVVVFTDMACPACAYANIEVEKVANLEGVKFVLRHFPLPIHKNAVAGARAVQGAFDLSKGWEMENLMYQRQSEWDELSESALEAKFSEYADEIGLDVEEFLAAWKSDEVKSQVDADLALARSLALPGTPSIFVDGMQVNTALLVSQVESLLK